MRVGEGKAFVGSAPDHEGHRAVVHKAHPHVGAEDACPHRSADGRRQRAHMRVEDRPGELGSGRAMERRSVALAQVSQQRELADGEDLAADVGDAPVDWVVRVVNYSPPSQLQAESRGTTMEALFHQYRKSRGI